MDLQRKLKAEKIFKAYINKNKGSQIYNSSLDSSLKSNYRLPESINIEEYISIKSLNVEDST